LFAGARQTPTATRSRIPSHSRRRSVRPTSVEPPALTTGYFFNPSPRKNTGRSMRHQSTMGRIFVRPSFFAG
jgi:hypothetical protein